MEATNFPLGVKMTNLPSSMYTGFIRNSNGKMYVLVKAAGAIPDGQVVSKDGTAGAEITVQVATAAESAIGVNNFGAAIVSGEYFWALQRGVGYCHANAAFPAGLPVMISAVAGRLATIVTLQPQVGIAIATGDTSVLTNNVVFFSMPGSYNG